VTARAETKGEGRRCRIDRLRRSRWIPAVMREQSANRKK
jgi:hypothetical protein